MVKSNLILLSGIFIISFIFIPVIIDYNLIPKYILLSLLLILLVLYSLKSKSIYNWNVNIITVSYTGYVLINILSVFWAKNLSENLFDSTKLLLGFFIFWIYTLLLEQNFEKLVTLSTKYFILIAFLFSIVSAFLIFQIHPLTSTNLSSSFMGFCGGINVFCSFLFMLTPFCLYGLFRFQGFLKSSSVVTLFLLLWVMLVLQTRSVWISLVAVSSISLMIYIIKYQYLKNYIHPIKLLLFFVLLFGCVYLTYLDKEVRSEAISRTEIIHSASPQVQQSNNQRIVFWQKSFCILSHNYLIGVGTGNWQFYFPGCAVGVMDFSKSQYMALSNPHNDFLWIISEVGFVGFGIYLVFICCFLFYFVILIQHLKNIEEKILPVILFIFFTGYLIISLFDYPKQRIEHVIFLNIILSILYLNFKNLNLFKKKWYFSFSSKLIIPIIISTLVFIFFFGILRFKGEYYTRKVKVDLDKENWQQILNNCNKAISFAYKIEREVIPVNWYRGKANEKIKKFDAALNDYEEALRINPFNRDVLNDLGYMLFRKGNYQKAQQYFEEALRVSPSFDEPKINMAYIHFKKHNYQEAYSWYKKSSTYYDYSIKREFLDSLKTKIAFDTTVISDIEKR
jgi:tetratricopeptide (TPR) repeat protein